MVGPNFSLIKPAKLLKCLMYNLHMQIPLPVKLGAPNITAKTNCTSDC